MSNRYSDEWTASLLDPERRLSGLTPSELLREAGLRPGMTVVDYGSGPGLITLHAAEMVGPTGRVYALDIHEGMVSLVESRAADAGLANVTTLLNDGELYRKVNKVPPKSSRRSDTLSTDYPGTALRDSRPHDRNPSNGILCRQPSRCAAC